MPDAALEGIRVLELGELVSAPYCAKLFADYGADVVKVEAPGYGDTARRWGPFPNDQAHPEKSGLFHFLNTNKRGVSLDVSTPSGRQKLLDLVARADVLIENHPPGGCASGGSTTESSRTNPDLVMISITPSARPGPTPSGTATT
jgi:crotonobetainyl-CoA:carnitine CoA-transferase CaiB-like acyl-CoA transferase